MVIDYHLFKSEYGGGKVTAAQYITEMVCARRYRVDSSRNVPDKFWEDACWAQMFTIQIKKANSLLKKYHPDAILRTLRSEGWIYSLYILESPSVKHKLKRNNNISINNIRGEKNIVKTKPTNIKPNIKRSHNPSKIELLRRTEYERGPNRDNRNRDER